VSGRRLREAAIPVLLVALYLLTRLALLHRVPYFIDEGTHGQFAYRGAHSLKDLFVSLTIGKEPLLIWIAVGLIKLGFGPLTAVRLVSLASGLVLIWVMTWLGAEIGEPAVGLLAAGLCVVLPFFVVHDAIGIMEPLLTLLLMTALCLQIRLARAPSLRLGLLLGLVLGAALLTKESGQIALALLPLSLICFDWRAADRRRRLAVWLGAALIALAVTAAADLLLRSSSYYGIAASVRRNATIYPVRSWHDALLHPLAWWRLAEPIYRTALTGYVGIPLLGAALVGVAVLGRRERRVTLLLLGWLAAMSVAAVLFPVNPYPRHVLYLVPIVTLFAAEAIAGAARALAAAIPQRAVAGLTVAAGVLALLVLPGLLDGRVLRHPATASYPGLDDLQYVTGPEAGLPWPTVAALLRRRGGPGRTIVATDAADADVVQLLLGHSPRFVFVDGGQPLARQAQFALKDELPFPNPPADRLIRDGGFRLLARLARPRDGAVVLMFERSGAAAAS
jgi:4-amino-4-deoxy-L-arabinose transferase-like glycosyltransferase